ncbi:MAG TPA: transporter substrate-binding domain-containing protein [Termitinemataceae bacterium]|nr:transporter substrate-binding domain-containing protein [Termitinemataceae bacterium]HOM24048.1 transporter substrate-binding domain-containing protein [Termitinemataceae bacterium]HPQ01515.1 transporter substrate-binding domain-containing protein [Termitinemataceae bacterium]
MFGLLLGGSPFTRKDGTAFVGRIGEKDSSRTIPLAIGEWAPYTGKNLPEYGTAARIVSAAFRAVDLVPVYTFLPWNRCEYLVKKGEYFASFPYLLIPEREEDFWFSAPLFISSVKILRYTPNLRTNPFVYDGDPASLKAFRVGTTEGTNAVIFPLKAAGVVVEPSRTLDLAIKKLAAGRLDLVIEEEATIRDAVRRLFPGKEALFEFLPEPFLAQREYRLMVSKRYPRAQAILERFNEGLRRIKEQRSHDLGH